MTKRRLIRWSLLFVSLAAFAVWLEPTPVVWGWLHGEAFYEERPASYWGREIERWTCLGIEGGGPIGHGWTNECYVRFPTAIEMKVARLLGNEKSLWERPWPTVFDGDPAGEAVLRQLAEDSSTYVRAWAAEGLDRMQSGAKGPNVGRSGRNRKPTPNQAVQLKYGSAVRVNGRVGP